MGSPKSFPKGTRFDAWSLFKEKQRETVRYVIKRWVHLPNGPKKFERLPVAQYAHFRGDESELKGFLVRLNAEHKKVADLRDKVSIQHAYIDDALIERYKRLRGVAVPSKDRVSTEIFYLRKHFLNFFIHTVNLQKPQDWHRVHKVEWAEYLLSDAAPKAPSTKRDIIQAANRFIAWLLEERPTEVPALVFKPLSKDRFKELIGDREIDITVKKRTFIKPEDWTKIARILPSDVPPENESSRKVRNGALEVSLNCVKGRPKYEAQTLFRRSNHGVLKPGECRGSDQGTLPSTWIYGADVLPVEEAVRGTRLGRAS